MSDDKPVEPNFPDAVFSERFRKSYRYAFGLMEKTDFSLTDVEDDPKKWIALNLNPQQLSVREPFATAVTPTQGGGKIVESRGQIIKMFNVSGTTGYLPPQASRYNRTLTNVTIPRGRLIPLTATLDHDQGQRSGFYAFHKLRYLFRRYGYLRRLGRTDVSMVFVDFKNDDYWRIEPDDFALQRSSRKPFSYDYAISFKGIEPLDDFTALSSQNSADDTLYQARDVGKITPRNRGLLGPSLGLRLLDKIHKFEQDSALFQSMKRVGELLDNGLAWANQLSDAGVIGFQVCLSAASKVVQYFQDVHDVAVNLAATPLAMFSQLDNALSGWVAVYNEFTDDNLKHEADEWFIEMTRLSDLVQDHLRSLGASNSDAVSTANRKYTTSRMRGGATTDTMKETGDGSPDVDPMIGASGLDLVTDTGKLSSSSMRSERILHGEDIYVFALRTLGSLNRFIDIVIINELEFPYIVPDTATRQSSCRAWGDILLVPSTDPIAAFSDSANDDDASSVEGTVDTAGTTVQLVDSTQAWRDDQWVGYTATATIGGVSESHVVVANDDDTITVNHTWALAITPGVTTYTVEMVTFDIHRPLDAEARAYGRDLLVRFTSANLARLVQGANGDLAQVRGKDNLIQAVSLRARCPIGHHPFHPRYGLPSPVGRPVDANVAAMALFNTRRSLLADPRIVGLQDATLEEVGDKFYLAASVVPVLARTAVPIRVQVGG